MAVKVRWWVPLVGIIVAWGAALLSGCASLPAERRFHGTLTKVERDQRYEAPCPLTARLHDATICDVPPVCCSYELTAVAADGTSVEFFAFWPNFAEGLKVGEEWSFHLHRRAVWRLPCTLYGCTFDVAMALDDDTDVTK